MVTIASTDEEKRFFGIEETDKTWSICDRRSSTEGEPHRVLTKLLEGQAQDLLTKLNAAADGR